jgi:hypothetical protein
MRKEKAKHNKGTFLVLVGTTFGGKQKGWMDCTTRHEDGVFCCKIDYTE